MGSRHLYQMISLVTWYLLMVEYKPYEGCCNALWTAGSFKPVSVR